MAFLTPELMADIAKIINDHHTAFAVSVFGEDAVASDVLEMLKKKGLIDPTANGLEDAYLYGQVVSLLENPEIPKWSEAQFKAHIKKNPIPLTPVERSAIQAAKLTGANFVVGLGNQINKETGAIIVSHDKELRKKLKQDISDATARNIAARETAGQLKSDIGWKTGDWQRNLDRIAITEKHNAMQQGVADNIEKKFGDDARVALLPMPDACPHCKRLHLGPDGQPFIFKLSQLAPPGSNVGKKAIDWVPVIGALHPHCQCQLIRVPNGWGFDAAGDLAPGGEYGVEVDTTEKSFGTLLEENRLHLDLLEKAYKLDGQMDFQGLDIAIENDQGGIRFWGDPAYKDGKGATVMYWPYGYIQGTEGNDGDAVDCYVGPNPNASMAYVIHQRKKLPNGGFGGFDEDKVMLGFSNPLEAKAAYLAHFDSPEFFGAMDAVPMPAFVERMQSKKKHAKISGIPVAPEVFTIPSPVLEKAKPGDSSLSDAIGGAVLESDPGRVAGTAVNMQVDAPKPNQGERQHVAGEAFFIKQPEPRTVVVRRDLENYEMLTGLEWVNPISLEDGLYEESVDADYASGYKETTERMAKQNLDVPRNLANPGTGPIQRDWALRHAEDQDQSTKTLPERKKKRKAISKGDMINALFPDVLEKGAPHLYESKEFIHGKWIYHYAKEEGGKVRPHKTEQDKVALKLPKNKAEKLHKLKAKHSLAGDVIMGGQYAILVVTAAEAVAMTSKEAGAATVAPDKPAKKKATPKATKKKKAPVKAPADLSDVPLKPVSDLKSPPKAGWQLASGQAVTFQGKDAVVKGWDWRGRMVLDQGGKRRVADFKSLKVGAKKDHVDSFQKLKPEAIRQPTAKQRELVAKVLEIPTTGATPKAYSDWLTQRGHEVYLVGGIVRDMLGMTQPGQTHSDADILEAMNDVDFVSSAPPDTLRKVFQKVGNVPATNPPDAFQQKGCVNNVVLDFASLSSGGVYDKKEYIPDVGGSEVPSHFDHDLDEDAARRDFTCNALYYDVHNDAIIDPSGNGVEDARNKVLRMLPGETWGKNDQLAVRYWKFIARGWTAEPATEKEFQKRTVDEFKAMGATKLASRLGKQIAFNAKTPAACVSGLRKAMQDNDMGHVYDAFVKPIESALVMKVKKIQKKTKAMEG